MTKNTAGNRVIDIRDQRIPRTGRIVLSSRTPRLPEFRRREAAVRTLVDRGEWELLERLRKRRLRIETVTQALADGDLDRLRKSDRTGPPLTLRAACDRLLQMVRATRSAGTYERHERSAGQLCEAFGADRELQALLRPDLEAWIHAPKETTGGRPWAPGTQDAMLAFVGLLYSREIQGEAERSDAANERPRVRRNPAKGAEIAGETVRRVEFLRPPEWRRLIQSVVGRPVAALLALGALAGLRISEAAHLRVGLDVELEAPGGSVLHIQPREGEHAWRPKTANSVRDVPVGRELHEILAAHVETGYAGQVYLLRSPFTRDERPLNRETLRAWTAEAFRAAGIRYGRRRDALTHHSLRHSFASWLVQEDVSPLKVAQLMGVTVEMVVRVYGHLIPSDLRQAVAVLDAKLGAV